MTVQNKLAINLWNIKLKLIFQFQLKWAELLFLNTAGFSTEKNYFWTVPTHENSPFFSVRAINRESSTKKVPKKSLRLIIDRFGVRRTNCASRASWRRHSVTILKYKVVGEAKLNCQIPQNYRWSKRKLKKSLSDGKYSKSSTHPNLCWGPRWASHQ